MIIHYNHNKPVQVYVVNSRLPVYKTYYGDGLGNTILGFFTRMAPKVAPFVKQLGAKAIGVIGDKTLGAVGEAAGKTFSFVKDKVSSLFRRKQKIQPLPSTENMPPRISKAINNAAQEKITSLIMNSPELMQNVNLSSAISGSGLRRKR